MLSGQADGRAVTAAAFPVEGTVHVALVATQHEAHGKEYAEALMQRAMEQGLQGMGPRRVTSRATDMGQPLLRAMGGEPGAKVVVLVAADGQDTRNIDGGTA